MIMMALVVVVIGSDAFDVMLVMLAVEVAIVIFNGRWWLELLW